MHVILHGYTYKGFRFFTRILNMFAGTAAKFIYFYGPMGVTVICNICLFILTAVKIVRHKKETARQLKGSDSKRHDDNKQWYVNMYTCLHLLSRNIKLILVFILNVKSAYFMLRTFFKYIVQIFCIKITFMIQELHFHSILILVKHRDDSFEW